MTTPELLAAARKAGVEFRLVGGRIEYRPVPPPPAARPLMDRLRERRAEVAILLAATAPAARVRRRVPSDGAMEWVQ